MNYRRIVSSQQGVGSFTRLGEITKVPILAKSEAAANVRHLFVIQPESLVFHVAPYSEGESLRDAGDRMDGQIPLT